MPRDKIVDKGGKLDHVKGHVDADRFFPHEVEYLSVTVFP
jgi:hypothetical protein